MIIIVHSAGVSFSGLGQYLSHDAKAATDERVAWTHTHNLAHDDVHSAIDEMLWTYRDAELLKQEAGVRAGGRATEKPVKHVSLNWSPEESPSQDHMINSAEEFLRHMKWDEHQVVMVAHRDKEHSHVHLMINAVHPETGLKLDDGFEQHHSQEWALNYEREHGIFCEQRLENAADREASPTRPMWKAFENSRREFEAAEKSRQEISADVPDGAENQDDPRAREWLRLRGIQKDERMSFFAEGKLEFKALRRDVAREVREEFRERWADYYAAVGVGGDLEQLGAYKDQLVAEQSGVLEQRRDECCAQLREVRDETYRTILDDQKEMRSELRSRQDSGLDSTFWLKTVAETALRSKQDGDTRSHRSELTAGADEPAGRTSEREPAQPMSGSAESGLRPATGFAVSVGLGALSGFGSLADRLADGLVGGPRAPRSRPAENNDHRRRAAAAAENAGRDYVEKRKSDEDEYRKKQEREGWDQSRS